MEFLKQNSALTLEQGLEELYEHNPEVARTSRAKGKSFIDHDLTHVIFGCDTSIHGELVLKPGILFGTTITVQELKDYAADEEVQRLNKEGEALLGGFFPARLKMIVIYLPHFIYTWLFRVRRMTRKWPHAAVTPEMLRSPLADLRREYGINVIPTDDRPRA